MPENLGLVPKSGAQTWIITKGVDVSHTSTNSSTPKKPAKYQKHSIKKDLAPQFLKTVREPANKENQP